MDLFLSYAKEDEAAAAEISKWLTGQGLAVFDWQDPRHRGGRIVEVVQEAISEARAFVALVSPDYEASNWCHREWNLALQIEIERSEYDRRSQFIHVLQLRGTDRRSFGFLRGYAWHDGTTTKSREESLAIVVGRLARPAATPSARSVESPRSERPARAEPPEVQTAPRRSPHRRDELAKICRALDDAGGPHFWLVTSPPGFGKSVLLKELTVEVAATGPHWRTQLIDIREEPPASRNDAPGLLARLLGLGDRNLSQEQAVQEGARRIRAGGDSHLCLMDSAELLDRPTTRRLRQGLAKVYELVRASDKDPVGFAFVVASRRDDDWRGIAPQPRFANLLLAEFGIAGIRRALADLAIQMGSDVAESALDQDAGRVLRLTEGHPALVDHCLAWIRRERWAGTDRLASEELFTELVRPYIRRELLSADALVPDHHDRGLRPVLERALMSLVPFRLITASHLRHCFDTDPGLSHLGRTASSTSDDLWRALSSTALLVHWANEPWHELPAPIRRLLFRYFYATKAEQVTARHGANEYVAGLTENWPRISQVHAMVERLWHEAALLQLEGPSELAPRLLASARTLTAALGHSEDAMELRRSGVDLLTRDDEFQDVVRSAAGLFDRVRSAIGVRSYGINYGALAPMPAYIVRDEEEVLRRQAAQVGNDGSSRVVLLYGPGGSGKTQLLRRLARDGADNLAVWLDPIDVDDPQFSLLSNLELNIAEQLDPGGTHFAHYREHLARPTQPSDTRIGRGALTSHFGPVNQVFIECYRAFADESPRPVVITLDTVEDVRGTDLLLSLSRWMKALPDTLFILAGRPPSRAGGADPILEELRDPGQPIEVTTIELSEFSRDAARKYLDQSAVQLRLSLSEREAANLVDLTRGHPLWLALTVDYLRGGGVPPEAEATVARTGNGDSSSRPTGRAVEEAFKRRLVSPYQGTDFWREAIKRLAVVRKSVDQHIWRGLMADCSLPADIAGWDQAWEQLLRTPGIRPRANLRYVTLHDALADVLVRRVVPLHDDAQQWRRSLWRRAVEVYGRRAAESERRLAGLVATIEEPAAQAGEDFVDAIRQADVKKRELDQLKAAGLYFHLLSDFQAGTRRFLEQFEAGRKQDLPFENLIVTEMLRLLPATAPFITAGEAERGAMSDLHRWLTSTSPATYLDIGLVVAGHLLANGQPQQAEDLLSALPADVASAAQRYRHRLLLGDVLSRIPGRAKEAKPHFDAALAEAAATAGADRDAHIAAAHTEMGRYLSNEGNWAQADEAYRAAHDILSSGLSKRSPPEEQEKLAAIRTSWARVKGLRGEHRQGLSLVESALKARERLRDRPGEGTSWTVHGELLRFDMRYESAWVSYQHAQEIFVAIGDRPMLGVVYQEQAICLFQAAVAGVTLLPDAQVTAEHLITQALVICRHENPRAYPSALNRAGRIFGHRDGRRGLSLLNDAIDQARQLTDGRFWFASLIEYVELNYRCWSATGDREHLEEITSRVDEIARASLEYEFANLIGRWEIVQGHLGLHDELDSAEPNPSETVLRHYIRGFRLVAENHTIPNGTADVPIEFRQFAELFERLPTGLQETWEGQLRRAWRDSPLLLTRLDELC